MDLDKMLSREQKEMVILTRLTTLGVKRQLNLKYDRRYGWDFEVRSTALIPRVTFSVPLTSDRFGFAVTELARALMDVGTHGSVGIKWKVCVNATRIPGALWMKGATEPTRALTIHRSKPCVRT
jgi:hypothetical protein